MKKLIITILFLLVNLNLFCAQQWISPDPIDSNETTISISLNQGVECLRLYDDVQQYQFELFLSDSLIDLYQMSARGYQLAYINERESCRVKDDEIIFLKDIGNDLVDRNTLQGIEIMNLTRKKKSKNILIIGGIALGFVLGVAIAK